MWGSSAGGPRVDAAFVQPATEFATQQPSAQAFKPFPRASQTFAVPACQPVHPAQCGPARRAGTTMPPGFNWCALGRAGVEVVQARQFACKRGYRRDAHGAHTVRAGSSSLWS